MKITFLGAAGGDTGSKHLVETNGKKILLDCGSFQGRRADSYEANSKLPTELNKIDTVILSHAHADHCCSLPLLVKNGYNKSIYTTPATADIARLIMLDSAKLQENDYEHLKKYGVSGAFPPIYSDDDVERASRLFKDVPYHQEQKIAAGTTFEFYDAGHILDSAITVLKSEGKTLVYTGDLGNTGVPILPDPEKITEPVDVLISESTYGDRNHAPIRNAYDILRDAIKQAVEDKSKIIVPAFALGRTQELIYVLHELHNNGEIPEIPIFIDSPLSNSITEVFKKYNSYFDKETWQEFINDGESPFSFSRLNYIKTVTESKMLNDKMGPLVIIASSGMIEGGRVLHHVKNNIQNSKAIILLTGYQAENTLGNKLEHGAKKIKIYGEEYDVHAKILKLDELSAHADQTGLLNFILNTKDLKKLILVHGENQATATFAQLVKNKLPNLEIIIPTLGESLTF